MTSKKPRLARPKSGSEYGGQPTCGIGTLSAQSVCLKIPDAGRYVFIKWGRPLRIDDKHCNITLPADFHENPYFGNFTALGSARRMYFSPYQRELIKVYRITMPILEELHHLQSGAKSDIETGARCCKLAKRVIQELGMWRVQLPEGIETGHGLFLGDAPTPLRVRRLQSLALRLASDNLSIMVLQPFLLQYFHSLQGFEVQTLSDPEPPIRDIPPVSDSQLVEKHIRDAGFLDGAQAVNSLEWWQAAVRITNIATDPALIRVGSNCLLASFLTVGLLNSAIVLTVHALSAPLSHGALEAKRVVVHIFRIDEHSNRQPALSARERITLMWDMTVWVSNSFMERMRAVAIVEKQ